ncbi:MAG: LacI family DNA-binding transcriptional regulator [Lachnospiraceae bacterium]|nr:LacI family DNA-binding transcriptional regulator [Candidatus Colinaster equi]
MVSMKDISLACGVSVATVSKSLNDQSDVGEETKQRIRQVAKEMGYFPNSSARALKTNKSYNIGVLFVDEIPQSGLTHDYFASILDSFKITVEAKGYDITFINCNKVRKGRLSYLEHSKFRGVDGVLIACVNFEDEEVKELAQSDIPVVTIDYAFDDRLAVLSDNSKGISDLLRYVYEQGHRDIAYIYGQSTSGVTKTRIDSFKKTAEELGLEIHDEYLIAGKYRDIPNAAKQTATLLNMINRPTCIFYADDYSTIGGMNEIKARGMNIPDDISIVGYDGSNIAAQIEPKLTTIMQDTRMIGKVAAENLIDLIERPKNAIVEHVVIEGVLQTGKSVKKIGR